MDEVSMLRELPRALGGLGLSRHGGLGGQQASPSSRKVVLPSLEEYFPTLAACAKECWVPLQIEAALIPAEVGGGGAFECSERCGDDAGRRASTHPPHVLLEF